MRIAIISEYNHLTTTGGTEYYTEMLASGLQESGNEVVFISLGKQKDIITKYLITTRNGFYQLCLLPETKFIKDEVRQIKISSTWGHIKSILNDFSADIIHVHTLSTFFNINHLEECRLHFKHIFFTPHVPGHFCLKGDLIKMNMKPCNGIVGFKCKICVFSVSWKKGFSNLINGYDKKSLKVLHRISNSGIKIICVSEWQKNHYLANGFDSNAIFVIRQALKLNSIITLPKLKKKNNIVRIGYLGRLSEEKGSDLLLKCIQKFSTDFSFQFVLGIPNNSDQLLLKKLHKFQQSEKVNIEIKNNINSENKLDFFASIDLLFIPSFCIETGPIVLLEAVHSGTIVLAPNIGGPLEFKNNYPAYVCLYKWNDIIDIKSCLYEIKKGLLNEKVIGQIPFLNNNNNFLEKHTNLYEIANF